MLRDGHALLLVLITLGCGSTPPGAAKADASSDSAVADPDAAPDGGSDADAGLDAAADGSDPADSADDGMVAAPAPGCPPSIAGDSHIGQALPTASVSTDLPAMTGKTVTVPAGGDLQAAINSAQFGDTLELEAGATFGGPITLPSKNGSGWIIIRTSTPDASFAKPGVRVDPSLAPKMAKIVGPAGPSIVATAPGAHHYRLIGLEIVPKPGSFVYAAVNLTAQSHDIILDRLYVHGDPLGSRRGVALNSKSTAIVNCHIADFREKGADSQAICGWDGPGPYRIVNNFLSAASENIMFGGGDPSVTNLVPSDIQVCGNHLKKDLTWKGGGWAVKNLFELKNARRVLVAGNVMEYNWADAQTGFAVLFTPRNQDGSAPWSVVEDVTFAYNIVRHTGSGLNALASDNLQKSAQLARVVVHDNLFDDIDPVTYGGQGRATQYIHGGGGGVDLKFDHNTFTSNQDQALMLGDVAKYGTNFVFSNNIVPRGLYGVFGSGQGEGKAPLDYYLTSYVFERNAIFGAGASAYPSNNLFPATIDDVGFANKAGGDWSLASSSKLKNAGSDGRDLGADIPGLVAATAGVAK